VFYSYEFAGSWRSGELRQWLFRLYPGDETQIIEVIRHFPRGAKIEVSVDPKRPDRSVGWAR